MYSTGTKVDVNDEPRRGNIDDQKLASAKLVLGGGTFVRDQRDGAVLFLIALFHRHFHYMVIALLALAMQASSTTLLFDLLDGWKA